jgi:hypothetical protein
MWHLICLISNKEKLWPGAYLLTRPSMVLRFHIANKRVMPAQAGIHFEVKSMTYNGLLPSQE